MSVELRVNGQLMPSLATYKYGLEPAGVFERNANYTLVGDLVAEKVVLTCTWEYLTRAELSLLLQGVQPFWLSVTYMDGRSNSYLTKDFYVSPQAAEAIPTGDAEGFRWRGVIANFIER